jgi:hypothetical protein
MARRAALQPAEKKVRISSMTRSRNKKVALAALAISVALAIQLLPPTRLNASDHIDSPSITHDRSSDIADTKVLPPMMRTSPCWRKAQ